MADAGRHSLRRRLLAALAALAPPVLRPLLRLLQASLRIELVGAEDLHARWARGGRAILCFWHNRLLMLPIVAAGQRACIMVSQHRDGEIGTRLLAGWGIDAVRGSATRGAVGGFLRLVAAYRDGSNLVVLPDGPKGPRYVAKPGVVRLAKAVGAPIYPMAYAARPVRQLDSWDRLLIPLPFARVAVLVGAPVEVPAAASPEEVDALCAEVERRLLAVTAAAEARVGMVSAGADAPPPATALGPPS